MLRCRCHGLFSRAGHDTSGSEVTPRSAAAADAGR